MEINEIFNETENINVYRDGNKKTYSVGQKPFEEIILSWNALLNGCHDMPAFGVSLHNETVKAMKNGLWVEFEFEKELRFNELPFEKLLVEVNKNFGGFNLIRYNKQYGYDGRCIYIDLVGENMSKFYQVLVDI